MRYAEHLRRPDDNAFLGITLNKNRGGNQGAILSPFGIGVDPNGDAMRTSFFR